MVRILCTALTFALAAAALAPAVAQSPPPLPREFRGLWVATVYGIDWPSSPNLTSDQQKAELRAIMDKCVQEHLNAFIFQVRPAADAMYDSPYEPWSEYLTGKMGQAPSPYYDPLAFACTEAHQRGLELHAWINPFRAHMPAKNLVLSPKHVASVRPDLVKSYGRYLWLDPGEPDARAWSLKVVADIVKRYDVDAVHMDDYFYPYKEKDANGSTAFPDEISWAKYQATGGTLSRDDWRRDNINVFMRDLYAQTKAIKPWVKVGVSPFGIWHNGNPEGISGFDAYSELYADSRKWLQEGWTDYWSPQLYWTIASPRQSYPVLLKWWAEQNVKARNLWPGLIFSHGGEEIANQVKATRQQPGATGNCLFSATELMKDAKGVATALAPVYAEPALVPASPWLIKGAPAKPKLSRRGSHVSWKPGNADPVRFWVVRTLTGGTWTTAILPSTQTVWDAPQGAERVSVMALDRAENAGPGAEVTLR